MTFADRARCRPPPGLARRPRMPVLPIVLLLLLLVAAAAGVRAAASAARRVHQQARGAGAAGRGRRAAARPSRPGARVRVGVPRGRTLVAQWELVRPLSADGQPMGEEVRGSSVLQRPSGHDARLRRRAGTADARLLRAAHHQRVDASRSGSSVNAGLQGAVDCGCAVRAGRAPRVHRLLPALSEQHGAGAGDGAARPATFRDLGPQVTAADGSVGLRFEDKDLRSGRERRLRLSRLAAAASRGARCPA